LPRRSRARASRASSEGAAAPARPLWSGTITFGLVSIPVDLLTAVRPRQTAMKLVDSSGQPLGRRYYCSKEDRRLGPEEIVRGYETDDGKMVVITDEELESVAPEMSGDIELRSFVPLEQIPPVYFQRPYFLAPAGNSAKAYHLLAATMEKTGRVGIGSFVMRGHEYLVAIISDNGVLRADTLRYADEIRTSEALGLPKATKVSAAKVSKLSKAIEHLTRRELAVAELEDQEARAVIELAAAKKKEDEDVIHSSGLEEEEDAESGGGAKVVDLMDVLRKSLSKSAVVKSAGSGPPISLAERRAQRNTQQGSAQHAARTATKKKTTKRRASSAARSKAPRRRARRA
jgi:DNA end-binding protein Ku